MGPRSQILFNMCYYLRPRTRDECGRTRDKDIQYSLTGRQLVNETIYLIPITPTIVNESTLPKALPYILHHRLLRIIITTPISRTRIPPLTRTLLKWRSLDLRPHSSISCFFFRSVYKVPEHSIDEAGLLHLLGASDTEGLEELKRVWEVGF